ncbi:MAG: Asp-tRNA(Asn)/Glu-tRNA(Gln) amidotransferase GatCAB subunit B, partial [Candidatus Nanopelagicales bacterium]
EEAEDYRYFPEPDLVPIAPSRDWVNELRETLPENPSVRRARLQAEWEISDHDMNSVISAGALDLVVSTIDAGVSHTAARKWWLGELSRIANERGIELGVLPILPSQIAEIENLISDGTLNDKLARSVIDGIVNSEGSVQEIIQKRNLALVSDDSALLQAIEDALASSPDVVQKIQEGKLQAAGAIVGAVMKATGGQADAAKVKELLFQKLGVSEG